LLKPGEREAVT